MGMNLVDVEMVMGIDLLMEMVQSVVRNSSGMDDFGASSCPPFGAAL